MRRTDIVRNAINEVLKNKDEAVFEIIHLNGVSSLCNLSAIKRGWR